MKHFYLRLPDDLWLKIKQEAKENGKSANALIQYLLENFRTKVVIYDPQNDQKPCDYSSTMLSLPPGEGVDKPFSFKCFTCSGIACWEEKYPEPFTDGEVHTYCDSCLRLKKGKAYNAFIKLCKPL